MIRSINRNILALALPAIAANITTPLLGMVDTAISGHLAGPQYIGAIAIGSSMFNMIYWLFGFLRMGTSGMTARAYGADDADAQAHTLARGLAVALGAALLMILLQRPLCTLLLTVMEPGGEIALLADRYFTIVIYGAPAMLGTYVLTGWLIGRQDTRSTLYVSLVINIVNILTSLTLVYMLDLGADGIAFGTLTAQWAGLISGVLIIRRRHRPARVRLSRIFAPQELKRFMSVNTDIFLRTLCLVATTLWFTRAGAVQGQTILAANAILMQLFIFFSYFLDGFAYAAEALIGRHTGALGAAVTTKSRDAALHALRLSVRQLMLWGGGVALLFTLFYAAGGGLVMRMLTSHADVLGCAADYRWWAVTIPLCGFMAFTWDGIFIGAELQRRMLYSMAAATLLFFVAYYLLTPFLHNHALWLAFVLYLLARGIVQSLLWPHR